MSIVWGSLFIGVAIGILGVAGLIFAMAIIHSAKYPDPVDDEDFY